MTNDVAEEHKIWKINSPFMYDIANFHTLDWPSLTCQWLPYEKCENDCKTYKLILGTHADNDENKLIISDYKVWKNDNQLTNEAESRFPLKGKFEISKVMYHKGDVNRARYMPQNHSIIATRSSQNDSFIYDSDKCILILRGHTDEGYGLSWNPHIEGHLLTCSFDKKICTWDISKFENGLSNPVSTVCGHSDKVEDISWHPNNAHLFASVGDDKNLLIWDDRQISCGPQLRVIAHNDEANCLSWHSLTDHLILTGGSDGFVYLWDQRKLVHHLHPFNTGSPVYKVEWSPQKETLFLSAGLQRRIHIWDVEKIGNDVLSNEEEDDTPPELVMMHSGHTEFVNDVNWHPYMPSCVASVADDNLLNVWQMADWITNDD